MGIIQGSRRRDRKFWGGHGRYRQAFEAVVGRGRSVPDLDGPSRGNDAYPPLIRREAKLEFRRFQLRYSAISMTREQKTGMLDFYSRADARVILPLRF
jgi:hypothetical protein